MWVARSIEAPLRQLAATRPVVVLTGARQTGKTSLLRRLFRHLKVAVDSSRSRNGCFLLTGSQKFTLMKGVTESLAGRAAVLELETLSLAEISGSGAASLEDVLFRGGFPELHAHAGIDVAAFYSSCIVTYLERDVRALSAVGSLRDFERFLRACALRSGNLLNKAELARDVGIAPSTANQ